MLLLPSFCILTVFVLVSFAKDYVALLHVINVMLVASLRITLLFYFTCFMGDMNIINWNVRGLNSPIKRTKVLEFLRHQASIALLQETHLRLEDVPRFQNRRFKVIVNSCATAKSKAVLIMVDRRLHITVDHIEDNGDRFVLAACTINNTKLLLCSVYIPNDFDPAFFTSLQSCLLKFLDIQLIMGGNFNSTIDPALDRSAGNYSWPSIFKCIK